MLWLPQGYVTTLLMAKILHDPEYVYIYIYYTNIIYRIPMINSRTGKYSAHISHGQTTLYTA